MLVLVTYDLKFPVQNYKAVIAKIQEYGKSIKLTESCWLIRTGVAVSAIRDGLVSAGDADDRFFVCEVGAHTAWKNLKSTDADVKAFIEGK